MIMSKSTVIMEDDKVTTMVESHNSGTKVVMYNDRTVFSSIGKEPIKVVFETPISK
jgi:hypothetical protein